MQQKKPRLIAVVFILLIAVGPAVVRWNLGRFQVSGTPQSVSAPSVWLGKTHPLIFYDEKSFYDGVDYTQKENLRSSYHITGGITPHHLLPGFIYTDFYRRLSFQRPLTIILIGPNHPELGSFKVLTSLYGWQTPFGVVSPNEKIINDLINHNYAQINEGIVENEHSVAGSMSFIKYYLPDATVVPLIVSATMTQGELNKFTDAIVKNVDTHTVVVAPVDFSHYLTNDQAQAHDKITYLLMKNYDISHLLTLDNDYVDSSRSIAAELLIMQKLRTTTMNLLFNTNSGELEHDIFSKTTSYFSIAFH